MKANDCAIVESVLWPTLSDCQQYVSIEIPGREFAAYSPEVRYIFEMIATGFADLSNDEKGFTFDVKDYETLCRLVALTDSDPYAAAFEAWIGFDLSPTPPVAIHLPHPLTRPRTLPRFFDDCPQCGCSIDHDGRGVCTWCALANRVWPVEGGDYAS
jgi:hypothetical protein